MTVRCRLRTKGSPKSRRAIGLGCVQRVPTRPRIVPAPLCRPVGVGLCGGYLGCSHRLCRSCSIQLRPHGVQTATPAQQPLPRPHPQHPRLPEGGVPIPHCAQPFLFHPAACLWDEAAGSKCIHSDPTLPVVHLAASERPIVCTRSRPGRRCRWTLQQST